MAKCSKCGKHGLFLKLNVMGLCKDCVAKAKEEFDSMIAKSQAESQAMNDECNRQIRILLQARDDYKSGGRIEDAIAAYERVLVDEEAKYPGLTHRFFLADLYIKAKMYDKAWGYLNSMLISERDSTYKVRMLQVRVLKNENKYLQAMEMLLRGYYFKEKNQGELNKDSFIKESKTIANKLCWSQTEIEQLFGMLSDHVRVTGYDEEKLIKLFREKFNS